MKKILLEGTENRCNEKFVDLVTQKIFKKLSDKYVDLSQIGVQMSRNFLFSAYPKVVQIPWKPSGTQL